MTRREFLFSFAALSVCAQLASPSEPAYDVCVVGGGPAGIVLASLTNRFFDAHRSSSPR